MPIFQSKPRALTKPQKWDYDNQVSLGITADDNREVGVTMLEIDFGVVNLSHKSMCSLLPRIGGYWQTITALDLSNNQLTSLPDEIGHLANLQELNVGNNRLASLPSTISYCQKLCTIDASSNQLEDLPTCIRHLRLLTKLSLANNKLTAVPACLWNLHGLEQLDLSHNSIRVLPAPMFMAGGTLAAATGASDKPRPCRLVAGGCPLGSGLADHILKPSRVISSRFKYGVIAEERAHEDSGGSAPDSCALPQRHPLPSLVDTVVLRMASRDVAYAHNLPDHLQERINSLVQCNHCHTLYPASTGIKRWRLLYRNNAIWPVEYNFCKPHWSDERRRIASLFGPRKLETNQPYYESKCAALARTASKLASGDQPSHQPSTLPYSLQTQIDALFPSAAETYCPSPAPSCMPYRHSSPEYSSSSSTIGTPPDSKLSPIRQGFRRFMSTISGGRDKQQQLQPRPMSGRSSTNTLDDGESDAINGLATSSSADNNSSSRRQPGQTEIVAQCGYQEAVSVWHFREDDVPALPALQIY
ncbi:hypothetical protein GGI12_002710 [Dipsacomyces acuminosporus]|nr:hypothetical protein GGI12_002710 [Dipsacomyces acuminosporus]